VLTLFKHPAETITYVMDFSTLTGYSGPRGNVWPQGQILRPGETLGTGGGVALAMLPLLFAMLPPAQVPQLTIRREDGQASDLTVTGAQINPTTIVLTLGGGSDEVAYLISASANTNLGELRQGDGRLVVTTTLF
jgi:hypothetical protein